MSAAATWCAAPGGPPWLRAVLLRALRWAAALLLAVLLCPAPARAHELSMAELEIRQRSAAEFVWQWTAGQRNGDVVLQPRWPAPCRDDDGTLRCSAEGLSGQLEIDGLGKRHSAVLVRVHWLEGGSRLYTLTKAQPSVRLFGSADDRRGFGEIAAAYTLLGFEHILTGIDHLLFVVALLFLVGFGRRLLWTITAFTAAHSLTLILSALGWIALRAPPVEAAIAASIVLVAAEALGRRQTLARQWPALVALLFGLVHGLGFAGGLAQIGLPQNHLLAALLAFNLGVELGQLLVIAAAWLLWRRFGALRWAALARAPALYAIGIVAAYWSWDRVAALFEPLLPMA
jgi:hydrogenase/urease accessory protein HupE